MSGVDVLAVMDRYSLQMPEDFGVARDAVAELIVRAEEAAARRCALHGRLLALIEDWRTRPVGICEGKSPVSLVIDTREALADELADHLTRGVA